MFASRPRKGFSAKSISLAAGACLVLATIGCGSGERDIYHVSGTATFDGQAIPAGYVIFYPDVAAGNDGTQGYAEIKDGTFDTSNSGKGITGGDYVARLRGFVPAQGDVPARMLFREYKQSIELPTSDSRQEIAVPASARAKSEALPDPT